MRSAAVVLWGAVAAAVAQLVFAYPRLPETMATHFDASGSPDGWASKAGYCWVIGIVLVVTVLCCAGTPLLMRRIPVELWNVPDRDDWLEGGHSEELIEIVGAYTLLFGALTVLFFVAVNHLVFRVALGEANGLGSAFYWLLGGYLGLTGVWVMALVQRLRRGPSPP